jgi:hypothetical protein
MRACSPQPPGNHASSSPNAADSWSMSFITLRRSAGVREARRRACWTRLSASRASSLDRRARNGSSVELAICANICAELSSAQSPVASADGWSSTVNHLTGRRFHFTALLGLFRQRRDVLDDLAGFLVCRPDVATGRAAVIVRRHISWHVQPSRSRFVALRARLGWHGCLREGAVPYSRSIKLTSAATTSDFRGQAQHDRRNARLLVGAVRAEQNDRATYFHGFQLACVLVVLIHAMVGP